MNKQWVLTQDAFDMLLAWLDPDRDRAGQKYEQIRLRLIKIFTCRGCYEAEELADETINRVVARVEGISTTYDGNPVRYFYGVAQKVHLEYLRLRISKQVDVDLEAAAEQISAVSDSSDDEPAYGCLEKCLDRLPDNSRKLVVEYYQREKHAKIDHRKLLAAELGIAVNALRIRAHRIRRGLEQCVRDCMAQQPAH
jgi:DNA-directed RNA polymerase specialized sigma24 family protein